MLGPSDPGKDAIEETIRIFVTAAPQVRDGLPWITQGSCYLILRIRATPAGAMAGCPACTLSRRTAQKAVVSADCVADWTSHSFESPWRRWASLPGSRPFWWFGHVSGLGVGAKCEAAWGGCAPQLLAHSLVRHIEDFRCVIRLGNNRLQFAENASDYQALNIRLCRWVGDSKLLAEVNNPHER
jgi:hypothetical protein